MTTDTWEKPYPEAVIHDWRILATETLDENGKPDGHMLWRGRRGTASGTPILRLRVDGKTKDFAAAHIAFWLRTGRLHQGVTRSDCGMTHCIAPDHVFDRDERLASRKQIRDLLGMAEMPERCQRGNHRQDIYGALDASGNSKCQKCASDRYRHRNIKGDTL